MSAPENHKWEIRVFHMIVNSDTDPELISSDSGHVVDACNTRSNSAIGSNGAKEKIHGEVVLYENINNNCYNGDGQPFSEFFKCIGSARVNDNHVEFWADPNLLHPPYIRINGRVVCLTEDLPITAAHPLQVAVNESCTGGEVYITDYNVPPMFFNIEDLMRNGGMVDGFDCTSKYFDGFELAEHLLIVQSSFDHPVFMGLKSDEGGFDHVFIPEEDPGLPVGYYTYSLRYVTQEGDRTEWSMPTPQIPVTATFGAKCTAFPYSATHSDYPDIANPTTFGIHLRLRINNYLNYNFIEIRRDRWNTGSGLGVLPASEIVGLIEVSDGELSIVNILDKGLTESVLSAAEATDVMTAIQRAKAIRYFSRRLYLANIEYASRVLDEDDYELGYSSPQQANMTPFMRKMGKVGHNDPWNATYLKSHMCREKFGYAIAFWDGQGGMSFADDIENFDNYEFPSRRGVAVPGATNLSYWGMVTAAKEDGTIGETFEVFDLENAITKPTSCNIFNILTKGGKHKNGLNIFPECGDVDSDFVDLAGFVRADKVGFKPFRPHSSNDDSCTGSDMRVNIGILNEGDFNNPFKNYDPKGFAPEYYARGISLNKIVNWPSWATAASIVRTKPAGKVIAQGMGHYALNSGGSSVGDNTTKAHKKLWCYFPDLDPETGINPTDIIDVKNNPQNYALQLVSPLGFFTEVYSFDERFGLADRKIDMITYARIIREEFVGGTAQINPDSSSSMGLQNSPVDERYVGYSHWLRTSSQSDAPFPLGTNGDQEFPISDVNDQEVLNGRGEYLVITMEDEIYNHEGFGGTHPQGTSPQARDWLEPLYIVNLVRKGDVNVSTQNIQSFEHTGTYIKFESVIGISSGDSEQIYELVDERWEDCIHTIGTISSSEASSNGYLLLRERFAYIKDELGVYKRWVNVTSKNQAEIDIILDDITQNGFGTVNDLDGDHTVYGVFTHTEEFDGPAPIHKLVFKLLNSDYYAFAQIPQAGSEIVVKYDNRIPIQIFGGDSFVGESMWAPLDLKYNSESEWDGDSQKFVLNIAFPNRAYKLNPRIMQPNKAHAILQSTLHIQSSEKMQFDNIIGSNPAKVRQLVNMFCCETRISMNYCFGDAPSKHSTFHTFPKKQYVMRPNKWDPTPADENWAEENNLQGEYEEVYGKEWNWWGYGGFRFRPRVNHDYSHTSRTSRFISGVPEVGFKEQNLFCTRIIWSAERAVNIQNAPGVRTFSDLNYYDLPDENGEIKLLWNGPSDNGQNLYAFTNSGAALLLTNKNLLHEAEGALLGEIGSDTAGVIKHVWISQFIGIADEMWRGFAEWHNICFWPTRTGVFRLSGNKIEDISRLSYFNKLRPLLQDFAKGYKDEMAGGFDALNREYILSFNRRGTGYFDLKPGQIRERSTFVVDSVQNSDIPVGLYEYGSQIFTMLDGQVLNVTCNLSVTIQDGMFIGGLMGHLLTNLMYVLVSESSPNPVKVKYLDHSIGGNIYLTMVIYPGSCVRFTPYTLTSEEGGYTNPYGDAVYFTADSVVLDNLTEQFIDDGCQTFRFSEEKTGWQGRSAHQYDKYLTDENRILGMRKNITYELNKGLVLNGVDINASFIGVAVGEQPWDKEFVRMRINSNIAPTSVRFYLTREDAVEDNPLCEVTGSQLKSRYGYEFNIPRKLVARDRLQGRILFYRVTHDTPEDFKVIDIQVQHKNLK
jgi:hypothetical protein